MSTAEYAVLFVLVLLSGAGIPAVGDAALIAAGTLAGEGRLNIWIVLGVAAAGWMLGSFAGYRIGARSGRKLLERRGRLEKSRRKLLARGDHAFSRHTFAASVKMKSYLSGIFRVGLEQFALAAAISGAARIAAYVGLSYYPGAEIAQRIGNAGGSVALGVLVVVVIGLAVKAAYSTWQSRRQRLAGHGSSPPSRVVSLLPSATEILYALGLEDQLVGVTFECDEPAVARRDKTVVVGGRDTSGMSPAAIDAYVRDQVATRQDLYTLDAGALATLAPDLILTQDLCRVCALPSGHVAEALEHLGCTADVLTLDPHSLDDVLNTILTVGQHTGTQQQAEDLVTSLRQRLADVSDRVQGCPRPSVAVVEWVDPPFTAGHWIPDLVTAAGGHPVAADPSGRSSQTNWDEIAAARPDVVIVAPCGFGLTDAAHQAETVSRHLPGTPIWAVDANGLVVRPGPRLVDGVEALASVLHADRAAAIPDGRICRIA